ncbi:MAG: hypothetical protein QXN93_05700 [Methanomassiliicoccales archaeon]
MNERDVSLAKSFADELVKSKDLTPLILNARTTQFMRINLILLKAMSSLMGMRGLVITIDRPSHYIAYLLKLHNISINNLTFVDIIAKFSSDRRSTSVGLELLGEPFKIDNLPELLTHISSASNSRPVDLNSFDFAIIDNLATLMIYNGYPATERFLRDFVHSTAIARGVILPILVDREKHPFLYEIARSISKKEVKIEDHRISSSLLSHDLTHSPSRSEFGKMNDKEAGI